MVREEIGEGEDGGAAAMATRLKKVKKIFHHFDIDRSGKLDHHEIAALVEATNPRVRFSEEQIEAILKVFLTYGDLLDGGDRCLTLDALRRTYNDGFANVDRDFDALGLTLDDDDPTPLCPDASSVVSGVSPSSNAQRHALPPRPRQRTPWWLTGELEGLIRRLRRRQVKEGVEVKTLQLSDGPTQSSLGGVSSPERIQESHPVGDGGVPPGPSPRPSVSWDRRSSLASSLASSSFSSVPDSDYGDRPFQTECEEIPSFRWLSPSLMPEKPPTQQPYSSEVDWEQLHPDLSRPIDKSIDFQILEDAWMVVGQDESSGKRCCLVLARGLKITWQDNRSSWRYDRGVAVLSEVCWLDIRAQVDAADISPATAYVCLLVFKLAPGAFGLGLAGETQKASVSLGHRVSDSTVTLQPARDGRSVDGAGVPRQRKDGWMEIELGDFWVEKESGGVDRGEVHMSLREVERLTQPKGGLLVRGMELRPKKFSHRELTKVTSRERPSTPRPGERTSGAELSQEASSPTKLLPKAFPSVILLERGSPVRTPPPPPPPPPLFSFSFPS